MENHDKNQLLKKIGKYSTTAGAVLLTGNLANASEHLTTTTIDLTFGSYHGIDLDGNGHNELSIYIYTSIFSLSDPAAFMVMGSDPNATSVQVIQGGPFDHFNDPAALPAGRIIGPVLATASSYWTTLGSMGSNGAAIAWTYYDGVGTAGGNFVTYPNETRYAGIRFTNDGGTTWHYGWIGLKINDMPYVGTGTVGSVVDFAYETLPNHSIQAGNATAVPVLPLASALGLGLAGLYGVIRSRRKKQQ